VTSNIARGTPCSRRFTSKERANVLIQRTPARDAIGPRAPTLVLPAVESFGRGSGRFHN
jgi:hypothetical protein